MESEANIEALRAFVVECSDLRSLELMLGRFNIFEVLGLANREIRHSNMIAWLLNPNETHGLGDLFMRRWLMRVFHESPTEDASYLDPIDIDATPFTSVIIKREWEHLDILADVVLENGNRWIVCIENKVWSEQHSEQLTRYRANVEAQYPSAKKLFILLSVRGEEPEDDAYVQSTYHAVIKTLEECLEELKESIPAEPLLVIKHYMELIGNRFMPNSPVEQLALKIYSAHKRALDIIFEHKPDIFQNLTDGLYEQCAASADSYGLKVYDVIKGIIWFVPKSWDVTSNKNAVGKYIVWCEINFYNQRNVVLKAVAGPADKTFREGVFELSKEAKFHNPNARRALGKHWYQFYAERNSNIDLQGSESETAEDIVPIIWGWVIERLHDSSFTHMVDSVEKFLNSQSPPPTSN